MYIPVISSISVWD